MNNRSLATSSPGNASRFAVGLPEFNVPPGSCDCHTHVFGPNDSYPLAALRHFTPEEARVSDLDWVMRRLGFDRVVLVQPSVYGTDNSLLRDTLSSTSLNARGVAVVAPDIAYDELESMHAVGVRGIRLNVPTLSARNFDRLLQSFETIFAKLQGLGWHIDVFANPTHFPVLMSKLEGLPIPVVMDHLGGPVDGTETLDARIDALCGLMASDKCWIKISAPYRTGAFGSDDVIQQLIPSLLRERPDRLLWGSDWPHTPKHDNTPVADDNPKAFRPIDTARLLNDIDRCLAGEDVRAAVLRDNPANLMGWD